ncbi:MAG: hypothetical protein EOP86_19615 [Verrucomicrobiaceae bacterium]|nr:MAG: hypothetical protein EOP86_19615 [Verrucomicrobiaceae bacterium]
MEDLSKLIEKGLRIRGQQIADQREAKFNLEAEKQRVAKPQKEVLESLILREFQNFERILGTNGVECTMPSLETDAVVIKVFLRDVNSHHQLQVILATPDTIDESQSPADLLDHHGAPLITYSISSKTGNGEWAYPQSYPPAVGANQENLNKIFAQFVRSFLPAPSARLSPAEVQKRFKSMAQDLGRRS